MSETPEMKFRLYVAGDSTHSVRARENLLSLCRERLPGRHVIEVVDILQVPERALDDNVLVTPLLVKWAPKPVRRIVGSLSDTATVLAMIGLPPKI